jgi:NAD-dependent deacetylase
MVYSAIGVNIALRYEEQRTMEMPSPLLSTLRNGCNIVALTGSGISVESGIPTFRDAQTGLWSRYDPHELATANAFRRNPKLVWEWYAWRRKIVNGAKPNSGHYALSAVQEFLHSQGACFTIITQNIDGLHQRAGCINLLELHGNINRMKCFDEDKPITSVPPTNNIPPRCPNCGGLLRPDVVWFGESLPADTLQEAWEVTRSCDIFFSIGTSTVVEPAASLPYQALHQGSIVLEINPNQTLLTQYATMAIQGSAGQVIPELVNTVWGI